MKELVIFDIDGTIVNGQSQMFFLRYLLKKKQIKIMFFMILLSWFAFYRLGLVKNPRRPMEYAFSFLKGKKVADISILVSDFFGSVLKSRIYMDAIRIITEQKNSGREIILVSNAIEPIVLEIARFLKINRYICSTLEINDAIYTGKINEIMYGDQKAEIVKKYIEQNSFNAETTWAYGDHVSDLSLLSAVAHPVAVNPSPALWYAAKRLHWPILTFKNINK